MIDREFEFHEVVGKVEERFRPELDQEAAERLAGTSESAGKYEPKMVSTGWWVVLTRFGVSIRFGNLKPDIQAGDTLVLRATKIPKKPDAPALQVFPPAPSPEDSAAALAAIIKERDEWREKALAAAALQST